MKYSILYLDDSEQVLRLFVRMFGGEYDVRTASKAADAFRMLDERGADIIISDQHMPETRGTEFLRRVSELHPSNFRMLLTGHAAAGGTLNELGNGVVEQLVTKPRTAATMGEALERAKAAARTHPG